MRSLLQGGLAVFGPSFPRLDRTVTNQPAPPPHPRIQDTRSLEAARTERVGWPISRPCCLQSRMNRSRPGGNSKPNSVRASFLSPVQERFETDEVCALQVLALAQHFSKLYWKDEVRSS